MDFETGRILVRCFNFIKHFEGAPISFPNVKERNSYKYWSMLELSNFNMLTKGDTEHYPLINGFMLNEEKTEDTIKNKTNYINECKSKTKLAIRNILLDKGIIGYHKDEAYHLFIGNGDLIKIDYSYNSETNSLIIDSVLQVRTIVENFQNITLTEAFAQYNPRFLGEM